MAGVTRVAAARVIAVAGVIGVIAVARRGLVPGRVGVVVAAGGRVGVVVAVVRGECRPRARLVTCMNAVLRRAVTLVGGGSGAVRMIVLVGRHSSTIPLGGIPVDSPTR